MPSPFQKYQSEQVQQIAPGFVEAYGRAGASIGQGIASAGQSIAQGMDAARKKAEEDAIQKGALAPYLQRDKVKIEAGVKSGSLIKNPDGTVSINPENPNKDMLDTSAIDFYNKTGGDINKLSGVDLKQFVASFESKKKIEAQEREAETNKVELDLKRAQTLKLTTEARLAEIESGNINAIYNAAGFANPGVAGSTIPTVPGSPVAPGAVARPSLSAYTGTGSNFDSNGLPQGGAFFESLARFDSNLKRGSEPATTVAPNAAAPADSAPADAAQAVSASLTAGTKAAPFNIANAAASIGMTKNDLVAAAKGMGLSPKEYVQGYLGEKPDFAAPSAPAVSPALTSGTKPVDSAPAQAAAPAAATAATAGAPAATQTSAPQRVEIERVRETAEVVQARINTLGIERTRLVQRMQEDIGNAKRDHAAIKARTFVTKGTGSAANILISYQESEIKDIESRYKTQIDAIDNQVKAEQGKLDIAKTVAASSASNRAETARDIKANQEETDRKRADVAAYPRIGPFVHIGSEIIRKGKEPSKYGIRGLTATAQNEVNTLAEGWIKSTDFIIGMANTLEQREALGQDYAGRMRLFSKDLENWATGELQQVFGVATFRRAIVSGGNFSDSDRLFVQRAITYINTLDPVDDKEIFEAATNALAKFVDNMYRKSMLGYDMKFDPAGLEAQAQALEDDGFKPQADQQRATADAARRFMDKFGIQDSGEKLSFDAAAVEEARATLWTTLQNAGKLKDIDKEVKAGDVVFRLRDSAPRSK